MIPYGRHDISQEDIDVVVSVLKSDFLTQGPIVPRFEAALADHVGAQHGVAVNSATSALHIACLSLGLGKGDLLWTTPITFVASANCGRYCGADVDFVDIDPQTLNMCPDALQRKLTKAAEVNKLPKVIVPVHMGGLPADMERIGELARGYGVKVIEDASHAIGARDKDVPVGNCLHSDITIFSFHPVKVITSAEGGMAVTNDASLADAMALLRSHGITRDPTKMTTDSDGDWYYQQLALGWNYRMTEMQGALGLSQLGRLEQFVKIRNKLAERYNILLAGLPLQLPHHPPEKMSSFHLYIVQLGEGSDRQRRTVFDYMRRAGIGVNVHYIPVHLQPYWRNLGHRKGEFPAAEAYYKRAISIPLHHRMTLGEQDEVVTALIEAFQ